MVGRCKSMLTAYFHGMSNAEHSTLLLGRLQGKLANIRLVSLQLLLFIAVTITVDAMQNRNSTSLYCAASDVHNTVLATAL